MAKSTPQKKKFTDEELREEENDLRKRGLVDDSAGEEEMEVDGVDSDDEVIDPDLREFDLRGDGHVKTPGLGGKVLPKGRSDKDLDDEVDEVEDNEYIGEDGIDYRDEEDDDF